jgi:leucyl aminopeptidase
MHIVHRSIISEDSFKLLIPYRVNDKNQDFSYLQNFLEANRFEHIIQALNRVFDYNTKAGSSYSFPTESGLIDIQLIPINTDDNYRKIKKTFRSVAQELETSATNNKAYLLLNSEIQSLDSQKIQAILNGLFLNDYSVGVYKSNQTKNNPDHSLYILTNDSSKEEIEALTFRAKQLAISQKDIFKLVDAPSNKKSPSVLAAYADKIAEEGSSKLNTTVLHKPEIETEGFYGLLAVNQASPTPPVFIKMEYRCDNPDAKHFGIVGKGVTFDTGGISLKRSSNLHLMKSDMGGGAAVLGLMRLVDQLQLDINLTGIVPATDNSIGQNAIKPSDVISSYSGKTIEIIDTDAEGRLLLADGLSYMEKNYNPDVLIDIATLTGSCITALGTFAAGFITNNSNIASNLMQSGYKTGEKVWELPNWDEYKSLIQSNIADVKNFSGFPRAGAITAAKFLEHFIGEHKAWAHLDIAGMAMENAPGSSNQVATAFGLHLLLDFIENFQKED